MRETTLIMVSGDQTLLHSEPAGDHLDLSLREGAAVHLTFRDGLLTGGTSRGRDGTTRDGFVMTVADLTTKPPQSIDLPTQGRTCFFCWDSEDAAACVCYQIDCGWLGL